MNLNPTTYYSVSDVATQIGRSKDWLWGQCRDRKVPHHRQGRNYVFTAQDVEAIAALVAPVPVQVTA